MDMADIDKMVDSLPPEAQTREEDTSLDELKEKMGEQDKPNAPKLDETVETKPESKPKEEPKPPAPQVKADLSQALVKDQTTRTVPVPVVKDLRERIRQRDAQLAEAKKRIADLESVRGIDPLKGVDDDEPLTAGQVRKLEQERIALERQRIELEQQRQEDARKAEFGDFVKASEADARSNHSDFDSIVGGAMKSGVLSKEDYLASMETDHPAEFLYRRVKGKMEFFSSMQGQPRTQPDNQPPKFESAKDQSIDETDPEAVFAAATKPIL